MRPSTIKTTHPVQCNFSAAIDYIFVDALPLDDVMPFRYSSFFFCSLVPILQCNSNDATMKTPRERMIVLWTKKEERESERKTDKIRRLETGS